jgi:lysophospholipase L1-like esterase
MSMRAKPLDSGSTGGRLARAVLGGLLAALCACASTGHRPADVPALDARLDEPDGAGAAEPTDAMDVDASRPDAPVADLVPGDAPAHDAPAVEVAGDAPEGEAATPQLPWTDDPCARLAGMSQAFPEAVARFVAEDDLAPPPQGLVVAVGSSTIRRWETATRELAPWGVVQRGLGGAWLKDLALAAHDLIVRHHPAAVVVFAGTNDLAGGRSPADVVDDLRCLVARVHDGLGAVPVLYVGVTPTPLRWADWPKAIQVHDAVKALAGAYPPLVFVDTPTPFLATAPAPDQPPSSDLFVEDGLHLSEAGYALWTGVVVASLDATVPRRPVVIAPAGPAPGSYVRIDLGPTNAEDGWLAPAVDAFGNHWNAWNPPGGLRGGEQVLAGEAQRGLVSTAGAPTGIDLVVAGGFRANGLRNGGLTSPPGALLQTLAVPEATADFFYTETADDPGALTLTGLDPARTYTLRFFASRASDEEIRVTRYVVHGAGAPKEVSLTTTGPDVGSGGYDGNDGVVAVLTGLVPDPWGGLHVDVRKATGRFAYLSLLELEVE